jgi:hypothetical protein
MPSVDRVRAGVGTSEADGAAPAGRHAAAAALAALAHPPALVLVYASVRYDLPALLAGVRDVTGDAPLAGATSNGHFHNGAVTRPGRGVAVLALTAGPYRFGVGSVTGLRDDPTGGGRALARAAKRATDPAGTRHAAMVVFADGLLGRQQELLAGVHKVAGAAVPVAGGAAGDDRQLRRTGVFHGDLVLTGGAVGVWVGSPWPLPVAVGHGWRPVGLPLLVTEVDGTVVHEIDGRPAVEVIREQLGGDQPGAELGWLRRSGHHPSQAFGLIEPDGSLLIRGVYLDDEGRLRTLAPLPTYAPIQVAVSEPDDMLGVVKGIVARATEGRDPAVLLGFSGVARLNLLRERGAEEAARLQEAAGPATATFGFYTYGEYARTTSAAGYHNATLAALAL